MSEWAAKRFWKTTEAVETEAGFAVHLDGRPVRTPQKSLLVLPSAELAAEVAREWDAQQDKINPLSMPFTRSANAAIDKVAHQHAEVAAMLASYAETDLLCHRAEAPEALLSEQKQAWDPLLDWAAGRFGAPLTPTTGILAVAQPEASLGAYQEAVAAYRPFALTGLHDLVCITGSLILGLWVAEGQGSADQAWSLSRIDEEWQIAQWGRDEEADEMAETKRLALQHAERFLQISDHF